MTPQAYSYIRFSAAHQAAGGSLDRQEQAAQRWAEQHGYSLDLTHRDLGKSAYVGKHRAGALGAFLAEVQRGNIPDGSALLIEAIDRLSREHVLDAMDTMRQIIRAGVSIVTLEDDKEYTWEGIDRDPSLWPVLTGKVQQARFYSQRLSMRVTHGKRKGRADKIAAGKPVSKMCPSWLRVVTDSQGSRYEPIPERVAILREMFERLDQDESKERICRDFNLRNVPPFDRAAQGMAITKQSKSRGWYVTTMSKFAHSRAIIGEFHPTSHPKSADSSKPVLVGDVVRDHFPTVVDRELFERVQRLRKPTGPRGKTHENVLMGVGQCWHCGSPIHFAKKQDRWAGQKIAKGAPLTPSRSLRCNAGHKRFSRDGQLVCRSLGLYKYEDVESFVIEAAGALALTEEFGKTVNHDAQLAPALLEVEAALADAESRFENLANDYGRKPSPIMAKLLEKIEAEIAKLTDDRRKLQEQHKQVKARAIDRDYRELTALVRQSRAAKDTDTRFNIRARVHGILQRCIDQLVIDADNKTITAWMGGGRLLCGMLDGVTYKYVVAGPTMLHITSGGLVELPTPDAILAEHLRIARGEAATLDNIVAALPGLLTQDDVGNRQLDPQHHARPRDVGLRLPAVLPPDVAQVIDTTWPGAVIRDGRVYAMETHHD